MSYQCLLTFCHCCLFLVGCRYFSHELFCEMMKCLGFSVRSYHHSKKLCYYLFQLEDPQAHLSSDRCVLCFVVTWTDIFFCHNRQNFPRQLVRGGDTRNNFTIVL